MQRNRVLVISQLPKEAGGTYTTGIARVVENLYQKDFGGGLDVFWYFTNVPHKVAMGKSTFDNQYNGYRIMPIRMLFNLIINPIRTIKEWRHYKLIDQVNPLRYEFYKVNIISVIKLVQPNLIHLHGAGLSPLYYASIRTKIPIMVTFHGLMYNEKDEKSWHFKPAYLSTMKMASYFTVLNQETKRKALALGMPAEKCETIPNGVDTSHFYYSERFRTEIREEYNASKDTLIFLTTGVVIDRKGQYDFMVALEQLDIDYQYWIIGKGPDEKKIEEYVVQKHIEHRVKMLGYVEGHELFKYLSAADFYAHVSTTEGQALSEIEAYATGLRIIVRKEIAGTVIGDANLDHKTYYIWDDNNSNNNSLKEWVYDNPEERHSKGKYDWAEIVRQYGDLYKRLLS